MPPPIPKNPVEREQIWGVPISDTVAVDASDPESPAVHLDGSTLSRIALFPEMKSMLQAKFGNSRDTDHHWFPVRPLGKGGFGGVAVWEKRNSAGDVIEETAVKQSKWSASMALKTEPFVPSEAAIMEQLNKKNSDNIVYLKGFKLYQERDKNKATWRFYFEYCPYGDLSRLQKRYRAWGTYFPEEFLWRTFHSLALVAQIMDDEGYVDMNTLNTPSVPYTVIHSDIKPLNVFLGYHAHPESPWHAYPVVKVGDWGLASLTNSVDPSNPQRFIKRGTATHLPPESRERRDTKKYGNWKNPPFDHKLITTAELLQSSLNPDQTDRKVNASHNVWAFGLTMYELLTHERAVHFSDRMNAMTEAQYNAWGQNTIPTITTHKQPEYSHDLRHLVRQCLNLRASRRPTIQQILEQTRSKLMFYEEQLTEPSRLINNGLQEASYTYQLPKLYYDGNEINNMSLGPHLEHFEFDFKQQAEFAFEQDKYGAPIWGPIRHPNRALWDWRYRQLVQQSRQEGQNRNGKRVQDAIEISSIEVFRFTGDRVFPPERRQANPRKPRRGPNKAERGKHRTQFRRPTSGRRDGFGMGKARSRQPGDDGPRKRQRIRDSVEMMLAPELAPYDEEESLRNIRNRRMHLWDEPPPIREPVELEEDEEMADDDEDWAWE